jgi:Concanavalin A-like lectin/glucanases superfamily
MHALYSAIATVVVALLLMWTAPVHVHAQTVQVNRSAPAARGLVGWWKALPGLAGSKNLHDLMGLYSGTLTNMAGAPSGWVTSSRPGGASAIGFDGTNDYVQVTTSAALEPATRSVLLWYRVKSLPGVYGQFVADGAASDYFFRLLIANNNTFGFFYKTSSGNDFLTDLSPGPTLGQWGHLALVMNSVTGSLVVYSNCQQIGQKSFAGTMLASGAPTLFGAAQNPQVDFFTGDMDDIRIYSRALTQPELCSIMRESMQGDPVLLPRPDPIAAVAQALIRLDRFFPFFQP